MRKKKFFLLSGTIALVAVSVAGVLATLLGHVPTFYQRCEVPASPERTELSTTCNRHGWQLIADLTGRGGGRWRHAFTEAQLNSFFEEGFLNLHEAELLKNHGISDPRIQLEDNKIRFAFRYHLGVFSTVISYDLRIWLVPREPNTIAIQVLGRRLGALPVSSQALLGEIVEVGRRNNLNLETQLYRYEGNPVVLVRYQSDGARPAGSLHCLKVSPASLTIGGGSGDAEPAEVKGQRSEVRSQSSELAGPSGL